MQPKIYFALAFAVGLWGNAVAQSQTGRLTVDLDLMNVNHQHVWRIIEGQKYWTDAGVADYLGSFIEYHPKRWLLVGAAIPLSFAVRPPSRYRDVRPVAGFAGLVLEKKGFAISGYCSFAVIGGYATNRKYFEYPLGAGATASWAFSRNAALTSRFEYFHYNELSVTSGGTHEFRMFNLGFGLRFNLWKIPKEPTKFDRWLSEKRSKLRQKSDQ